MGIPFKLYEGKEANLPAELTAGGIYFCEDSGNVFIDVDIDGTVTRVPLGKKYVDDQLVDIREFIENQGSGIEISDEPPTKESANVWINTKDEDEEGVEYLGVVTSINGQGGDVNITASDIDAAEKTHASQHAVDGSDPITPAAIGALPVNKMHYAGNIDEIFNGAYLALATATGDMPWVNKWFDLVAFPSGTGACSQIAMCTSEVGAPTEFKFRHHNGVGWSSWSTAATTDYALNKVGDMMTGVFSNRIDGIQSDFASFASGLVLRAYQIDDWDGRRSLILGTRQATSLANALMLGIMDTGRWVEYPILHTGNKPYYEYGGNGQVRTESVGGLGRALIMYSGAGIGMVTSYGAVFINNSGETKYFNNSVIRYGYVKDNGQLEILSDETNGLFNGDGVTYCCQVL